MTMRIKRKTDIRQTIDEFQITETMVILISVDIDEIAKLKAFNHCC